VIAEPRPELSEYASYLALDTVLAAQVPRTDEHDEILFIIAHQVHELWFKQLLHELTNLQLLLADGDTVGATQALRRIASVLSVLRAPMTVLETLTPRQFNQFRAKLGTGSGFQSAQFREIEAVLGRRDEKMYEHFAEGSAERRQVEDACARPTLFDSLLRYLYVLGHAIPDEALHRDLHKPLEPSRNVQDVLLQVYYDDGAAAQICERLIEIDQGLQEWRYRHVLMVSRILGTKPGTGGSSGATYLHQTLFRPTFPDLWAVRTRL
jgi:tryptophan 2,3-dioxygenase